MLPMAHALKRLLDLLDASDLLAIGGMALLAMGLWMVYPPAALIVPGGIFTAVGVWASLPHRPKAD